MQITVSRVATGLVVLVCAQAYTAAYLHGRPEQSAPQTPVPVTTPSVASEPGLARAACAQLPVAPTLAEAASVDFAPSAASAEAAARVDASWAPLASALRTIVIARDAVVTDKAPAEGDYRVAYEASYAEVVRICRAAGYPVAG